MLRVCGLDLRASKCIKGLASWLEGMFGIDIKLTSNYVLPSADCLSYRGSDSSSANISSKPAGGEQACHCARSAPSSIIWKVIPRSFVTIIVDICLVEA